MNNNILNRFAVNPVNIDIPRSKFNLDHGVLLSGNLGNCIPLTWFDVLPGDTFSVDTAKVIRLQPLVAPIMSNIYWDTYWFYVPYRLVWNHFINFMGENTDTAWTPQVTYNVPKVKVPNGGFNFGTVADYLGVPPGELAGCDINALPFRVYATIMNEWFRSESIMDPVHVTVGDSTVTGSNGNDQVSDVEKGGAPFIACKYFDLFTSALPSPQRGPAATFNLAGAAPVLPFDNTVHPAILSAGNAPSYVMPMTIVDYYDSSGTKKIQEPPQTFNAFSMQDTGLTPETIGWKTETATRISNHWPIINNLYADLSNVTQFNVNELRNAFAVQRYYEALARGGSRYISQVKEFYSVTSSDYRFMRPEYLGGNRISVNVSQIEQTSATDSEPTPIGSVAGMSVTGDMHGDFTKSFTEHGMIMAIGVMRQDHVYQQGLEKFWRYDSIFDWYNPKFANIGEQPVKTTEIYANATTFNNDTVFGYNEAWYEYRFHTSRVAGEMRSSHSTPLDMWHLGDYYAAAPSLSAAWLREDKSMLDRCLAVTSEVSNQFVADFYFTVSVARCMPMFSIPGLIDHH